MAEQPTSMRALEGEIVARALKDPAFRHQLIVTPREALATMGLPLPAHVQVRVIEQEPNTLYLVLPLRPAALNAAEELSEAELGQVAGGTSNLIWCEDT